MCMGFIKTGSVINTEEYGDCLVLLVEWFGGENDRK